MAKTQSRLPHDAVSLPIDVQQHCIDLPGEKVQCFIHKANLEVVLRKHRDVIFDLKLKAGDTYTVYATESDFYNARDKQIVLKKHKDKVTFNDGERLHLWVSRGFKGQLVLESQGKVMMRVDPAHWDKAKYDATPSTKPAPIIVAINANAVPGQTAVSPAAVKPLAMQSAQPPTQQKIIAQQLPSSPPPKATLQQEECPVVCVVDGKLEGMPAHVVEYFKKGGDNSGMVDIDPYNVATRNWIWGQVAGSATYVADNWAWLRASIDIKTHTGFRLVSAKVRRVGNSVRFYFSGYSKFNPVFGQGGFGPAHDRIMTIFSGAGSTASTIKATVKGIAGTFKANALVSFIFGAGTAMAEWKSDIKNDGYDLAAALIMVTIKAIVAVALVVLVVAAIVLFFMFFIGLGLSVLVVGILTICAGIGVNYSIELVDKVVGANLQGRNGKAGSSAWLAEHLEHWNKTIQESWQHLMKKFPKDYQEFSLEGF